MIGGDGTGSVDCTFLSNQSLCFSLVPLGRRGDCEKGGGSKKIQGVSRQARWVNQKGDLFRKKSEEMLCGKGFSERIEKIGGRDRPYCSQAQGRIGGAPEGLSRRRKKEKKKKFNQPHVEAADGKDF